MRRRAGCRPWESAFAALSSCKPDTVSMWSGTRVPEDAKFTQTNPAFANTFVYLVARVRAEQFGFEEIPIPQRLNRH